MVYQILLVEDSEEELNIYKSVLSEFDDLELTCIDSEAAGIMQVNRKNFDCMIVDLKIAGGNGMKIIHEARLHKSNRSTPIYVVSGFVDDMVRKIAKSFQVMDVIEKPFNAKNEIPKMIKRVRTKKTMPTYDANLINILVHAGVDTFKHYFKEKPMVGRTRLKNAQEPARGMVTAIISFKDLDGKGEGSLALSANVQFVKNLAKSILDKPEDSKLVAEEAADIMGEMSNQVIGRIKIEFEKRGANIQIGLPNVKVEKKPAGYHHTKKPVLFTPFGLQNYGCDLEFSLTKGTLTISKEVQTDTNTQESGSVVLFD